MASRIRSHRDLIVWQRSMDLVTAIYRLTGRFPSEERYGLTSQMRRAAVSIPSNISEGAARTGPREFQHFVSIARGSAAEVETHLELARRLELATQRELSDAVSLLEETAKMLTALRKRL